MAKNKFFQRHFQDHPCRTALGFTLLLFIVSFALFRPFFQTNDDALINMLLKGVGVTDRPCAFLLFINVLVGTALKELYLFQPAIPWYGLFLFSVLFLSAWAFLTALFSRVQEPLGLSAILLVFIPIFLHYFVWIQYTAVAFLAALAGMTLFLFPTANRKTSHWTGAGLLVLSSLIRAEVVFLTLLLVLPLGLHGMRQKAKTEASRDWILSLAFSVVLVFFLFDRVVYHLHPEWERSRTYVETHNKLAEYKMPDYSRNETLFRSVGWSVNDYAMFIRWNWQDPKFDLENCEKLANRSPYNFPLKFTRWKGSLFSNRNITLLALFFLLLALAQPPARRVLLLQLAWAAVILVLLTAFRKIPDWILYPHLSFCLLACLFFIPPGSPAESSNRLRPLLILAAAVISLLPLRDSYSRDTTRRFSEKLLVQDLGKLDHSPNKLYLAGNLQIPIEGISPFGDWEILRGLKFAWLSWAQRTPRTAERFSEFHLEKPLRDMVNRPDVFFIYNPGESDIYQEFMKQNEGLTVLPEPVFSSELFGAYRIRSAKPTRLPSAQGHSHRL